MEKLLIMGTLSTITPYRCYRKSRKENKLDKQNPAVYSFWASVKHTAQTSFGFKHKPKAHPGTLKQFNLFLRHLPIERKIKNTSEKSYNSHVDSFIIPAHAQRTKILCYLCNAMDNQSVCSLMECNIKLPLGQLAAELSLTNHVT